MIAGCLYIQGAFGLYVQYIEQGNSKSLQGAENYNTTQFTLDKGNLTAESGARKPGSCLMQALCVSLGPRSWKKTFLLGPQIQMDAGGGGMTSMRGNFEHATPTRATSHNHNMPHQDTHETLENRPHQNTCHIETHATPKRMPHTPKHMSQHAQLLTQTHMQYQKSRNIRTTYVTSHDLPYQCTHATLPGMPNYTSFLNTHSWT